MHASRRALARWQFEMTWSLFTYHLERLEPGDFRWQPAGADPIWTVRPDGTGRWIADWPEGGTEPDPVPLPTIGWLSWHIDWWWSVALDHVHGRPPRDRTDITWPGDGPAAVARLHAHHDAWLAYLDGLTEEDLDATAPYPWPHDPEHTVAHLLAWLNAELMKNAAEIGQLRMLRAVSPA
ncbi:DinB family protein [Streptomyces carpaticus]|uniref:DinB superfamily protein n=2 Tax=Streptomyces TaxID=1883 RepID=A0A1I6TFT5_9ACTN|nr:MULTISPECIES: DinB family protein [Streptomyces]QKV69495.1 DinB family protein [Streptomyces harbinensis]UWM49887.1 DinB family protein [Streptomyces carpaticus]SFS88053.1 DinB superfamily protein [Streptomyces harbinensis]